MLPFLKYNKKQQSGIATQFMGEKPSSIRAAADLIQAIENKDENAVADAFKKCFLECEKEPHEEASQLSDESDSD